MLITVDTGGTKTLIASFNSEGGIDDSIKYPTPRDQTEYIESLQLEIKKLAKDETIDAIVVALPGIIKNGVAVWCNNLQWRDFPAQKVLEKAFPDTPILLENDANLAGLAETRMLEDNPVSSLYVTISTGIGTGVITNNSIDPGLRHSEGGHALVEYNGAVQEWEKFASGGAVHRAYGMYARDIRSQETWAEIADRISRGFLAVIPIIQPDIIIIGGSMGTFFDKYSKDLERILKDSLPDHIPCPKLVAAAHPEEAVVYGCYYYAIDELATKKA